MMKIRQTVAVSLVQFFFLSELSTMAALAGSVPHHHSLHKRDLFQLCEMMAVHTNRGCLDYVKYGCYCGWGNANSEHVDDVDGCCRAHDECYADVSCPWYKSPKIAQYNYQCSDDTCQCGDSSENDDCQATTCECDLQFAQCLKGATYNQEYYGYDTEQCEPISSRSSGFLWW